jgi:hypothetical protein
MPVTTIDIPEDQLSFIDKLVQDGVVHNRREVVVRALEVYRNFQVHSWMGPLILKAGIRKLLISKGSLSELVSGFSEAELYNVGKLMGKTLRDCVIELRLDVSRPENHKQALQILEDEGWGKFTVDEDRITITGAIFPASLLHGYLETALSIRLSKLDTTEDICSFAKKKGVKSR